MTNDDLELLAAKLTPDQLLDILGLEMLDLVYLLKEALDQNEEEFTEILQGEGSSFSPWEEEIY